jgi:hypothetical protein
MNKGINILSFVLLFAFGFLAAAVIYDLEISNLHLRGMKYKEIIFPAFAVVVLAVGLLRAKNRWQGWNDMRLFKNFKFETEISKTFKTRSISFTFLEMMFMSAAIYFFVKMGKLDFDLVIPMIVVMVILLIESLLFLMRLNAGGDGFRIGISDKVIAYFARESRLIFYEGLRRVELHQSDQISFKYKDDLVIFLQTNVIPEDQKEGFKKALIEILEEKNIYFDDGLRNW